MYFNTAGIYRDKLFLIQKRAIRAMNCLKYLDHTNNYFLCNKILKLGDLHQFHTCVSMFKTFHYNFDVDLFSAFRSHSDTHQYSTRNSNSLLLPLFSKSKSQNSIDYVGSKLWNALPSTMKEPSSVLKYKTSLKKKFY